jgi:ArsR family transcriptional regulator, arsenate/arsenite/antimonite-responsive transcriptional repressor
MSICCVEEIPNLCCTFSLPLSENDALVLAESLKVLADPVRLRLISLIAAESSGEVCACNLPGAVGKSQPTVSHHMTQLVTAGFVSREQRGKWAWFRLRQDSIALIRSSLDQVSSSTQNQPEIGVRVNS